MKRMMTISSLLKLLMIATLLSGCDKYAFTLNDQTILDRAHIYSGYSVEDASLNACLQQTIKDNKIRYPEQLSTLRCSHAGIKQLAGIEHFPAIQQLDLSGNLFNSLAPLVFLGHLTAVDLSQNSQLGCVDIERFVRQTSAKVTPPGHCNK